MLKFHRISLICTKIYKLYTNILKNKKKNKKERERKNNIAQSIMLHVSDSNRISLYYNIVV